MISTYRSEYTNRDMTIQGKKAVDHVNLPDRSMEGNTY